MAVMVVNAMVLLLVGLSAAGPLVAEDESVSGVPDNALFSPPEEEVDPELRSYFSTITEVLEQATGEATELSGERVLAYNASSGLNPEELGEYFQGDILVPSSGGRNGLVAESTRWANGKVPYQIDSSFGSADRNLIQQAIKQYESKTCVYFVPRTNERDYIIITKANTGCWSSVGRIGGRQELNLQSPGCTSKIGTVIHELMHALGFMHEQNRSERDSYVNIMWGNIERGRENNFELARKGAVTGFGVSYDYGSVMHYSDYAFSINNKPTIVSKTSGVKMGQREGFSSGDITKIRAMYKCGTPR